MVQRNTHLKQLKSSYLFVEIAERRKQFLKDNPGVKLFNLGIGDTTLPLDPYIAGELKTASERMSSESGYSGYGSSAGLDKLREKIAEVIYKGKVEASDIFVSDGSKCDIGRLQMLFGPQASIAVQDPTYPVYVDGSILQGSQRNIIYLPCTPENGFFPDLSKAPRADLIYFCSPNNPTGSVATKEQLSDLVKWAKQNKSILIFDAAYSEYISDPKLPRTIYEIPGAEEVAIEVNSFSKMAGFTGLRLGWCVVPKALKYESGESVQDDWNRVISTIFNGPSNVVQAAGLAVLEPAGMLSVKSMVRKYMSTAESLKKYFEKQGLQVYGGINAPYVWVHFPNRKSWDVFQELLETKHIVATPGSGFGPSGEGFVRFSAFAKKSEVLNLLL